MKRGIKFLGYAEITLLILLLLVWPIPGTISISELSILLILFSSGYIVYCKKPSLLTHVEIYIPLILYAIITVWLFIVAVLISKETVWSLNEIKSQWIMPFAVFLAGILISLKAENRATVTQRNVMIILCATFLIHVLYVDLFSIQDFLKNGQLPINVKGLTAGHDQSSYLSNYLISILAVEIFFRKSHGKSILPASNPFLILILFVTIFSIYVESARNGTVTAILSILAVTALYVYEKRICTLSVGLVIIAIIGFALVAIKMDIRWRNFVETIQIALDTEHNKAWLNVQEYHLPKMKNGEEVTESNYLRIAWLKEGTIIALENPLGIGYGRSAFGHAIKTKYNVPGKGHSHSGLLDFTIGAGIPGLFLLLSFLLYLLYSSFISYKRYQSQSALFLFIIVFNFSIRALVDSTLRDHMFQQFIFLIGIFFTFMLLEKNEVKKDRILLATAVHPEHPSVPI